MSGNLRREALQVFKKLHRTRLKTFQGDEFALKVARQRINDEYRKNKDVTNETSIKELIKLAIEVEQEVRTTVVQAVETRPGVYQLRITPDTELLDNVPYGQKVDKSQFRQVKTPCCSDVRDK